MADRWIGCDGPSFVFGGDPRSRRGAVPRRRILPAADLARREELEARDFSGRGIEDDVDAPEPLAA
jgi:hypothetical protein